MFFRQTGEQEFYFKFSDVPISFGKLGINEITHLKSFETDRLYTIGTDWISPYMAGTMVDGTPQDNHKACGGNHGTVGGGGYPTTNNAGTTVTELGEKEYKIVVKNEITVPANITEDGTRKSIDLVETVEYLIVDNKVSVTVSLESKTDVYLNWYLGLQATRAGWDDTIEFHNDPTNTGRIEIGDPTINSGTKAEAPDISGVTFRKNGYSMTIETDNAFGVGFDYIRPSDPVCYLQGRTPTNSGKFYWHLVKNGNTVLMPAGTVLQYRGSYSFSREV